MSNTSDITLIIAEAEDTLQNLKALYHISNNTVLNQNSKKAIVRQIREALIRHLDIIYNMSMNSFLEDTPETVDIKIPTIESEDDEEPIPKKIISKTRTLKYPKT